MHMCECCAVFHPHHISLFIIIIATGHRKNICKLQCVGMKLFSGYPHYPWIHQHPGVNLTA